jgi:hypothetical protein
LVTFLDLSNHRAGRVVSAISQVSSWGFFPGPRARVQPPQPTTTYSPILEGQGGLPAAAPPPRWSCCHVKLRSCGPPQSSPIDSGLNPGPAEKSPGKPRTRDRTRDRQCSAASARSPMARSQEQTKRPAWLSCSTSRVTPRGAECPHPSSSPTEGLRATAIPGPGVSSSGGFGPRGSRKMDRGDLALSSNAETPARAVGKSN